MGRRSTAIGVTLLMALAGCASDEEIGRRTEAIENGVDWDGDAIGIALSRSGCSIAGVFLTPRHFLFGGCFDDASLSVGVSNGTISPVSAGTVIDTLVGPEITSATPVAGNVRIAVLDANAPITMPARLADAAPTMGETVTQAGFGGTSSSFARVTAGDFTVASVTDMGAQFTTEPVGDVMACTHDVAIFNGAGELTGLAYYGVGSPPCFTASGAFSIAGVRTFIDESLAMPLPGDDGGAGDAAPPDGGPTEDAAASDAGDDAGTPDTGTGGGGDDGGCGCENAGRGPAPFVGWLFVAALFVWRRRRVR